MMVCPKCGSQTNSNVCAGCGTVLKSKKKSTGLIVLSVVLAVVIAACAAVYFLVIPSQGDIGSVARNYMTAAYYTDKVVGSAAAYASYDDYKSDLDMAIDACGAIDSGAFDFLAKADIDVTLFRTVYAADALEGLDTDADSRYTGGYTSDAKENADSFLAAMKKDAAAAKQALKALDSAVNETTDEDDIMDALSAAADALEDADNATIVVGDKAISFAGITTLAGINTAFIGIDIVINGDTLYLGADNGVMAHCTDVGRDITVINSQSGDGVVMETGNMADLLGGGSRLVLTIDEIGDVPQTDAFDNSGQFSDYISKELGASLGFSDSSGAVSYNSENGVNIADIEGIMGTWKYIDAVVNPFLTLDAVEQESAEIMAEIHKKPAEFMMFEGQAVNQYMIFRQDGTGIMYYDVEDEGIYIPQGFWWRKDEPHDAVGSITVAYGISTGYEYEWNDTLKNIMQNFQAGDYSDFEDADFGLFVEKNVYENTTESDYLYQYLAGQDDSQVCIVYEKVSDATDFDYGN